MCSHAVMKDRIDVRYLRLLLAVRLTLADRSLFRDLGQHRDRSLRQARRDELVSHLTQGWDRLDLEGWRDGDTAQHVVPPAAPGDWCQP